MKITHRIPTKEYAYVEIELEETEIIFDDIATVHGKLFDAFKPQEGLTAKELDLIVENMCLNKTVTNGTELWAKATQAQKDQINCLKRALKRIEAKNK